MPSPRSGKSLIIKSYPQTKKLVQISCPETGKSLIKKFS